MQLPIPTSFLRHCVVMELVNGHTLQAVTDVPDPAILYDKLIKLLIKVWLLRQFSVGYLWLKNHLIYRWVKSMIFHRGQLLYNPSIDLQVEVLPREWRPSIVLLGS